MITRVLALTTLLVLAAGGAALAQSSEQKAAASAAFDKAKQLMDDGDTEAACDQFARSQELDPQFGTQYNLALCYQQLGKLASAYGEFGELAGKDTNAKRKAKAKAYAAALKPRLTSLTLIVNDPVPQLVVERNDQDITLLVGVTTPVDPGVYTFEASAPGRKTWSQKVDLTAEGATITVEIPVLVEETVDDGTGDVVPDPDDGDDAFTGVGTTVVKKPAKKGGGGGKGRKLIGMITAGTGVVATGVGLLFGFQASAQTQDAKDLCGGQLNPCAGDVVSAQERIDGARGKAMLSTIVVGAGLVAVAAGVVIWLTAPDGGGEERQATLVPVIGADGGGLVLDGRF